MSDDRTHADELADVFASFAVETNPTGLSVGIDSAYELGDHIESHWLAEHDRRVAESVWDEAYMDGRLDERTHIELFDADPHHVPNRANPYRSAS